MIEINFDVQAFNIFNLIGIKEYKEGSENRHYGPVARDEAAFFALECRVTHDPSLKIDEIEKHEKYLEFDKGIQPEEIEGFLMANEHIAKCGISRLY